MARYPLVGTALRSVAVPIRCAAAAAFLTIGGCVSAYGPARGAAETGPSITAHDMRVRVTAFAHDSMSGRAVHTSGHTRATDYIARELARLGLTPAGEDGSYFQTVPLVLRVLDETSDLSTEDGPLTAWIDYFPLDRRANVRPIDGATAVFGGALMDSATWIPAVEANGRFVVLTGSVSNYPVERLFAESESRFHGARGVMITGLDSLLTLYGAHLSRPVVVPTAASPSGGFIPDEPVVVLGTTVAATALLGVAPAGAAPGHTGRTIRGGLRFGQVSADSRNVVAILPGSEMGPGAEYVALGAHTDHEGTRRIPPAARGAERDSVFNGADDNASGSMALLEIAEALTHGGRRPRRPVLFVWHTAEERGMLGARHFTENPTVARENIMVHVNLDMIGRGNAEDIPGGGADYLQVLGSRRLSARLGDLVDTLNSERARPLRLDYTFDAPGHPGNYYCRSDHVMYARFGIPVVFFTTGTHPDYHAVSDEPERLDYEKLAAVTGFVSELTVRLADLDQSLRRDDPDLASPNRPCVQ